ncbi:MAG: hypothetical protein ACLFU6_03290 [Candidatus Hydrogenedentota bacterium]
MSKRVWAVWALIAAAGCVTPPVNYYTLDMSRHMPENEFPEVVVGAIERADSVSRDELMVRAHTGEARRITGHVWVACPAELVREKLRAEFDAFEMDAPAFGITGTLRAFEQYGIGSDVKGRVQIEVRVRPWEEEGKGDVLLERTYEARTASASSRPGDVARALSRSVEAIARELAEDVGEL